MFLLKVKRSPRLRMQLPICWCIDVTMCTAPTSTSVTWGVLHLGALVTEYTDVTMDESKMARRLLRNRINFINSMYGYVANNSIKVAFYFAFLSCANINSDCEVM